MLTPVHKPLYATANHLIDLSGLATSAAPMQTSMPVESHVGMNFSLRRYLFRIEPRRLSSFQRLVATFSLWRRYVAGEIPTTPGSRYKHGYGTFWYRLNGGDW